MNNIIEAITVKSLRDELIKDLGIEYTYNSTYYDVLDRYNHFAPYNVLAWEEGLADNKRFYDNGDPRYDKIWGLAHNIRRYAEDRIKSIQEEDSFLYEDLCNKYA